MNFKRRKHQRGEHANPLRKFIRGLPKRKSTPLDELIAGEVPHDIKVHKTKG